ncbi:MarR family transcriptional regulator [Sphingomonas sp. ID0503]|uniref:MarR family transcriptional regulator n=1 Tax=Sphingomonas sp. ID0503 TaxID=3399691 RepID=UPI003AFA4D66
MANGGAGVFYGDQPGVLVFAADEMAGRAAADAVNALGARLSGPVPIAVALDRLETQAGADAILIEAGAGHPALDDLFHALRQGSEDRRYNVVASVPAALIDHAYAQLDGDNIQLIADPEPADRVAALHLAIGGSPSRVADIDAEAGAARLRQLSEEVARIARALSALSSDEGRRRPSVTRDTPPLADDGEPIEAEQVRAVIRARRLRSQIFDPELFSDPAWDMLLDLTAARLEDKQVAVSSLCIAAAVPPTTALRWIKTMTDAGLFLRRADPMDGRRVYITLSDDAADGMEQYMIHTRRLMREVYSTA